MRGRRAATCPRRTARAARRAPSVSATTSSTSNGVDAVHALEPDVLLARRQLDLLAQDLRVEQVLDADADPRRLVRVGRADPASRRADLQLPEPPLARAVERDVPRHDQVRVAGDEDEAVGAMPATLELVELVDQHLRVDDAAGADRARDAADDPRRDRPDLVGLAVDDDGVARRSGRPGSGRRGRTPGRAGRRSCPSPRRPTAPRRSRSRARGRILACAAARRPPRLASAPCSSDGRSWRATFARSVFGRAASRSSTAACRRSGPSSAARRRSSAHSSTSLVRAGRSWRIRAGRTRRPTIWTPCPTPSASSFSPSIPRTIPPSRAPDGTTAASRRRSAPGREPSTPAIPRQASPPSGTTRRTSPRGIRTTTPTGTARPTRASSSSPGRSCSSAPRSTP